MARTPSDNKVVKKIPSTETGHGVTCYTVSGDKYIISQNPLKAQFTLWKCVENGFEKISISKTPLDFEKIIYKHKNKM